VIGFEPVSPMAPVTPLSDSSHDVESDFGEEMNKSSKSTTPTEIIPKLERLQIAGLEEPESNLTFPKKDETQKVNNHTLTIPPPSTSSLVHSTTQKDASPIFFVESEADLELRLSIDLVNIRGSGRGTSTTNNNNGNNKPNENGKASRNLLPKSRLPFFATLSSPTVEEQSTPV